MPEKQIHDAYDRIVPDPASVERIWSALEQQLPPGKEKRSVKKTKKTLRILLAAALITILMIGTAYAVSGGLRGTATHEMPNAGEYAASELSTIERVTGYPVTVVDSFSNGYSFKSLHVGGEADYSDSGEILREYYAVTMIYSRPGAEDVTISLCPVSDLPGTWEPPAPSGRRVIADLEVRLSFDHYKIVPENYVKSAEDLAAEAAGHYYISFGSDEITEFDYAFADFTLDGVSHTLMQQNASASAADMLCLMAEELIAAAGG